jgi:hypothetical protein
LRTNFREPSTQHSSFQISHRDVLVVLGAQGVERATSNDRVGQTDTDC